VSRKSPASPAEKWLVGKRARIAGDLERLAKANAALRRDIAAAERKVERLKHTAARYDEAASMLNAQLSALDETMLLLPKSPNPGDIAAIKAWAGRYGKRGALMAAIKEILQAAAAEISTADLYRLLQERFGLVHVTALERKHWIANSLLRRLQEMLSAGLVERMMKRGAKGQAMAHWRWKQPKRATLAELRARASEIEAKRRNCA
jgi:hypothetical protein